MSLRAVGMSPTSTLSLGDDENSNQPIEIKELTDSDNERKSNHEKHTEIQEQVYQDKLASIKKQLQQLRDGTHVEYLKHIKLLELQQKNELSLNLRRLLMNIYWRDSISESIELEYTRERRLTHKDFDDRNNELTESLVAELNERRKMIETDHLNLELSPDSVDPKPAMTRKLRRRPNDPVVQTPQEKRRKPQLVSTICYMLSDQEIEHDVKIIQESLVSLPTAVPTPAITTIVKARDIVVNSSPIRKPGFLPSTNSSVGSISPKKSPNSDSEGSTCPDTRIEDGKLLFEKRWFHRGQTVFVEGKQILKFPAVISAIGNETIWVKKTSDNSKFRINLSYLSKGKMSIKRRAAV